MNYIGWRQKVDRNETGTEWASESGARAEIEDFDQTSADVIAV